MTINANLTRNEYTATAGQTVFTYTFEIFDAADLLVYVVPQGVTPNDVTHLRSDYTVQDVGNNNGGTITFTTGLTLNDSVVIVGATPFDRDTDYQENSDQFAGTFNLDSDRGVQFSKINRDRLNYQGVVFQNSQSRIGKSNKIPAVTPGKVIGFDSSGNIATLNLDPASTIPTEAVFVDTVADIASIDSTLASFVTVAGQAATLDKGAALFWFDAADVVSADNGRTIIVASDGARWKLAESLTPSMRIHVPTVAALRLVDSVLIQSVHVDGNLAALDGLGGEYYADASDVVTADNGTTVIVAADGMRWKYNPVNYTFNTPVIPPPAPTPNDYSLLDITIECENDGVSPNTDVVFKAGHCRDRADTANIDLSANITKDLSVVWASGTGNGGRASGVALAPSTTYHCFVIQNPTGPVVDAGFDTDIDAANLALDAPAFTKFRRVRSLMTDGSSNIIREIQDGGRFTRLSPIQDYSGTVTATAATTALTIPDGINVIVGCIASMEVGAVKNSRVRFSSLDQTDDAASVSNCQLVCNTSGTVGSASAQFEVRSNISRQIRRRANNNDNTTRLSVEYYLDRRLQ